MNPHKYLLFLLFAIVALGLNSCKPVEVLRQDTLKPMPQSFGNGNDTTNVSNINWRQYFTDQNLVQLIDTTLGNNLDLQIALQRLEIAQSKVLASEGALRPIVDATAGAALNKYGAYTMDGAGNRGTEIYKGKDVPIHLPDFFIGLQASWEIDAWGKLRNQKKAAVARFLASMEGKKLVQTNLIAEIATLYYELLALDTELKIIDETILLQENALAIVRVQKEAGAANELAVQQFEAQLLNLRGMRLETQQMIVENESAINYLLGRYPQPVVRDSSLFTQNVPPQIFTGIPSSLLQNRPDIRQAELELMASKADLNAAKALFYPSVNISGLLGLQAFRPDLLVTKPQSIVYSFMGGLVAPLVNKRAIQAEFNAASAYQIETLLAYQQTILNGYVEVYNEVANIRNLAQVFGLKTNEADVLFRSIATSNDLFRTSRATYLEVLIAQQNALQTRLELVNVKKRQFNATINIYRALGGGWQ